MWLAYCARTAESRRESAASMPVCRMKSMSSRLLAVFQNAWERLAGRQEDKGEVLRGSFFFAGNPCRKPNTTNLSICSIAGVMWNWKAGRANLVEQYPDSGFALEGVGGIP